MKKDNLNLPNLLTGVRILLAPAMVVVYFAAPDDRRIPALCLFLAAGLTDCLDGYFARKLHQITSLGKVLDPIADKLMSAATALCLIRSGVLPLLALIVIAARELYMAVGATVCLRNGLEVASDIYGKIATALFYPAVLLAWPWHGSALASQIGRVLIFVSVGLSVVASAHYTIDSVKKWRARNAR